VLAHEQAAKILEHRRQDFAAALGWTERALARVPEDGAAARALRHRAERLRRRISH
jgi:hypothetical protein